MGLISLSSRTYRNFYSNRNLTYLICLPETLKSAPKHLNSQPLLLSMATLSKTSPCLSSKENTSFSSFIHWISPLSVQPKSAHFPIEPRNSKNWVVKFWPVQLILTSVIWPGPNKAGKTVELVLWIFLYSLTQTTPLENLTVLWFLMLESHTEDFSSSTKNTTCDRSQSTICQLAEMSTKF